jgi:hypothetical protein
MKSEPKLTLRLLMVMFAIAIITMATLVWADGGERDGRRDDDRREFRGDNDHDWDDMDRDHHRESYAIGLWGDLPYSDVQGTTGLTNLIMDMNSQNLAFTAHDGDLKGGNSIPGSVIHTTCANELYSQALGYFDSLKAPAVFTPGDNDWTDCDRPSNKPDQSKDGTAQEEHPKDGPVFNSLERLDYERSLFFSGTYATSTFGQHRMHQAVQGVTVGVDHTPCLGFSQPNVPCVENRRWTYRGVTYATINIQGSCNNLCDTSPNPTEYAARNAADIAWMQETFEVAKKRDSAAIMFITQADPGFDNSDATRAPTRDPFTLAENDQLPASDPAAPGAAPDGFKSFLTALRTEVIAFRKPVAYVHGDSHYFRIDKPLYDANRAQPSNSATPRRIENFTRVETFGDNVFSKDAAHPDANDVNNVHWLKVFVDPDSREVFSFQIQIVPGNRAVVPAP